MTHDVAASNLSVTHGDRASLPCLHLFSEEPEHTGPFPDLDFLLSPDAPAIAAETAAAPVSLYECIQDFPALVTRVRERVQAEQRNFLLFNSPNDEEESARLVHRVAARFASDPDLRVLVLDTNCGSRFLQQLFDVSVSKGLYDILENACSYHEVVRRSRIPAVSFLGSGGCDTSPVSLLLSPRFSLLTAALTRQFDLVLINTPAYHRGVEPFLLARILRPLVLLARAASAADIRAELAVLNVPVLSF